MYVAHVAQFRDLFGGNVQVTVCSGCMIVHCNALWEGLQLQLYEFPAALLLQGKGHAVKALSFSPDGSLLAVAAGVPSFHSCR